VIKIIFDTNSPEKIPETVYSDAIDLFILFGDIDQEVFSGRKYITIGSNILTTDKISLQPDGAFAAMDMYDYLFSQGHRKIGLLLPLINYFFFSDMRSGYFSACGTRNIRPRIFEIESEHLTEQFTQIHEELSELDALILCTSCGAPEVISSLKDIGLSVPDNLSLIAVGGYEDCEKTRPRLTCYENDYPAMAKTLWQFLSGFFSGTITQPLRVSSKTFKLIERDSVCKRH
jgi:DNA-binding LacI/PurR family transcriptional regulator